MSIEDKIRDFITKNLYFADSTNLGEDTSFLAEGIIDSMGSLELVAYVESEFAIKVDMSEIVVKNFDSIRKLADFVRRKPGTPKRGVPALLPPGAPELSHQAETNSPTHETQ